MAKHTQTCGQHGQRADKLLIKGFIDRLEDGGDVSMKEMRTVVSQEALDDMNARYQNWKSFEREMSQTPHTLDNYVRKLRLADLAEARANRWGNVILRHKADDLYEKAWESLQEAMQADPSVRIYLDRDEFTDLTGEGAPRLRHGRSSRLQCGIDRRTRKDFKLETLRGTLTYLSQPQRAAAPKPPVHEAERSRFNHLPLKERLEAMRRAGMLG